MNHEDTSTRRKPRQAAPGRVSAALSGVALGPLAQARHEQCPEAGRLSSKAVGARPQNLQARMLPD